jgi:hypothetical protein
MTNAGFRIPIGILGMEGTTSTIIPGAQKPFDLLKDDLAIPVFTIENLFALWHGHDAGKAYSLLPFVDLSLTVRCPCSSIDAGPDFLQAAFSATPIMGFVKERLKVATGKNA